jgi:hypothetical protein
MELRGRDGTGWHSEAVRINRSAGAGAHKVGACDDRRQEAQHVGHASAGTA